MLTPRTIEVLVKHLYGGLTRESEKLYKRKSIWVLPIREMAKLKDSIMKNITYNPYIYDPTSGSSTADHVFQGSP